MLFRLGLGDLCWGQAYYRVRLVDVVDVVDSEEGVAEDAGPLTYHQLKRVEGAEISVDNLSNERVVQLCYGLVHAVRQERAYSRVGRYRADGHFNLDRYQLQPRCLDYRNGVLQVM